VRGDLLDLGLLAFAAAFAVSGYRQGFLIGTLSFVGFIGGAVLGAEAGPPIARALLAGQTQQDIVAVIVLVSLAIIGQFLASSLGAVLRSRLNWGTATTVDATGGATVSVLSFMLLAWMIGNTLVGSPFPTVVRQVNDSAVLKTVDTLMPVQARSMFSDFRRLLAAGPFPEVFSGIGQEHIISVPAPDNSVLNSAGFLQARSSVVKVSGTAPSCNENIEGSGFVYAPDHVLTNAHVVAGVTVGPEVTTVTGQTFRAHVVLYDPQIDIAVLYVPGLNLTPLAFAGQAHAGGDAVVAGYPKEISTHILVARPARIAEIQDAVSLNIYQSTQVTRQIYQIRGVVQQGNSGGPLLSPSGTVYGVVFAQATGQSDAGFALTAAQAEQDAGPAATTTVPTSTQSCD
jgi:S1-C subfamily serine protease